jgi:hypothetical protein
MRVQMKRIIIGLLMVLTPVLLMGAAGDWVRTVSKVNFALPRDVNGVALHNASLGLPVFSEAVTLTSSTATLLLSLPTTGNNANRQWRKMLVRNPDSTRTLYLCFVNTANCTTPNIKVPANTTFVLDDLYFGPMNSVASIYSKLDTNGSVTPEITIW